jgi:hypothetical protein
VVPHDGVRYRHHHGRGLVHSQPANRAEAGEHDLVDLPKGIGNKRALRHVLKAQERATVCTDPQASFQSTDRLRRYRPRHLKRGVRADSLTPAHLSRGFPDPSMYPAPLGSEVHGFAR